MLLVARLLWAFDITLVKDSQGNDLAVPADLLTAYDNSIIANTKVSPVSFEFTIQGRGKVISIDTPEHAFTLSNIVNESPHPGQANGHGT